MPMVVSFTEVTCSVKAKDAALGSAAHGSLKMNIPVSLRMGPGEGERRTALEDNWYDHAWSKWPP